MWCEVSTIGEMVIFIGNAKHSLNMFIVLHLQLHSSLAEYMTEMVEEISGIQERAKTAQTVMELMNGMLICEGHICHSVVTYTFV